MYVIIESLKINTKRIIMENLIINNKKAKHNFFLEDKFEAGIVLEGWEVKSLLAKKINIENAYIVIRNNELFLFNALITPLTQASTHVEHNPLRTRKLLLKRQEIDKLIGKIDIKGYTLIPIQLYKKGKIKVELALAKGKKDYDKREVLKQNDWKKEKAVLFKNNIKNHK